MSCSTSVSNRSWRLMSCYNKTPTNSPLDRCMLMMVLRRKLVRMSGYNVFPTAFAPINAGVRSWISRVGYSVASSMIAML